MINLQHKHPVLFRATIYSTLFIIILFLLAYVSLDSMNHILMFNGSAANGAFQLMNPLTRLANGEVVGRDFQFFHGAGVALIHYPLFDIFGRGLFGSEMSRWFSSIVLFFVSGYILCQAWFGKVSLIPIAKSLFAFIILLTFTLLLTDAVLPSNSLLGVRTTFPLVIGATLLLRPFVQRKYIITNRVSVPLFSLILGILLSIALLGGTEHGIAAIIAFLLAEFICIARRNDSQGFIDSSKVYLAATLPTIGIAVFFLLILASIISHGHPFQLLRYNILTVPSEQFWYFGAYPQGFLQSSTLLKQLTDPAMVSFYCIVIVSAVILASAVKLSLITGRQIYAIWYLLIYGFLTLGGMLGYFSPTAQLAGVVRVLIAVDALIIVSLLAKYLYSDVKYLSYATTSIVVVILLQSTLFSIKKVESFHVVQLSKDTYHNIKGDHATLLGANWQNRIDKFKPYLDQAKKENPSYPLWSTYSSLYEQYADVIHPSSNGCDYIIHCLGDEMREQYTKDFTSFKPTLVATLRPSYFGFEEWLWGRQADFYKHLIENYEIITSNDAHILWKIKNRGWANSRIPKALTPISNSIELPSTSTTGSQIIEVGVKYNTDKQWSNLQGVNKIPRYLGHLEGTHSTIALSLPPHKNEWKFLIVLNKNPNIQQRISFSADGLLPASMKIISASYTPINVGERELEYFTEKSALSISH